MEGVGEMSQLAGDLIAVTRAISHGSCGFCGLAFMPSEAGAYVHMQETGIFNGKEQALPVIRPVHLACPPRPPFPVRERPAK